MAVRDPLSQLGGAYAVPTLIRMPDGRDGMLSSLDGFILSRIDGRATVADIASMVGRPAREVALTLLSMADAGLVRLPASSSRPTGGAVRTSPSSAVTRPPTVGSSVSTSQPGRYGVPTRPAPAASTSPGAGPGRFQSTNEPPPTSRFERESSAPSTSSFQRSASSPSASRFQRQEDSPSASRFARPVEASQPTGQSRSGDHIPPAASSPSSTPGRFSRPDGLGSQPTGGALHARAGRVASSSITNPTARQTGPTSQRTGPTSQRTGPTSQRFVADRSVLPLQREHGAEPRKRGATFAERAESVLGFVPPLNFPVPAERALLQAPPVHEAPAMEPEMREVIAYYAANHQHLSPHELLGVSQDAPARAVRARYFQLSRSFHPDQWFRMEIGPYAAMVQEVFGALTSAYETMQQKDARPQAMAAQQRQTVPQPAVNTPDDTTQFERPSTDIHTADLLRKRSAAAQQRGDVQEAFDALRRATDLSPTVADFQRLATLALEARKPLAVVQESLTRAHQLGDRSAHWYALAGECALRAGNLQAATRGFQRALMIDPQEALASRRMSVIEKLRGNQG